MQTGDGHTAIVIEPNDYPTSEWMNANVVSAGDATAMATAGDNKKRLEWTRPQVLTDVSNHICATLRDAVG